MKKLSALLLIIFCAGCTDRSGKRESGQIVVSILPLQFFVDRITSSEIDVTVMVPPGVCPETYEPSMSQLMNLSKSKLYFEIGLLDFETTLFRSFPELTDSIEIVNLSEGLSVIEGHHHHPHRGAPTHATGADPHIWLSPLRVKKIIEKISKELIDDYPDRRERYSENTEKLLAMVDSTDLAIRTTLERYPRKHFLIYHPFLTYFADDYALRQISIEEEGKEPSAAHMAEVIHFAKTKNMRHILYQEQINGEIVNTIAKDTGLGTIPVNPLSYDWFGNMAELLDAVEKSLQD